MKAHHCNKRHKPIPSSMSRSAILRWRRYSSTIALFQTRRYNRCRPRFRGKSRSCRPRYKLRFRRRLNNRYLLRRRGIEVDILHLVRLHVCLFVRVSACLLAGLLLCDPSLNASLSLTANAYRHPSFPIAIVPKEEYPKLAVQFRVLSALPCLVVVLAQLNTCFRS